MKYVLYIMRVVIMIIVVVNINNEINDYVSDNYVSYLLDSSG